MSAETDINVFKQELEDAVVSAHAALDVMKQKFDVYVEKLTDKAPEDREPAASLETSTPE